MIERYPDDAALLARLADEQTGVEYIETGKAPYYLEFRRLLDRLLRSVAPLGLRVYQAGDLSVAARPGRYWLAGACGEFAGSASELPLADDATNYVYLNGAGELAASTAGWPDAEHVALAVVATAGGTFGPDDIADVRGQSMLSSLANLAATATQIDRALADTGESVTGANLNELTAGGATTLHSHDVNSSQLAATVQAIADNGEITHNQAAVVRLTFGDETITISGVQAGARDGQLLMVQTAGGNNNGIVFPATANRLALSGGGAYVRFSETRGGLLLMWDATAGLWRELMRDVGGGSMANGIDSWADSGAHVNELDTYWSHADSGGDVDGSVINAHADSGAHAQATGSHANSLGRAGADQSCAVAGGGTEAGANFSFGHGQNSTARLPYQYAHGGGAFTGGPTIGSDGTDCQFTRTICRAATADATPTVLATPTRYIVPAETTCQCVVRVLARSAGGAVLGSFVRTATIDRSGASLTLAASETIGTDLNASGLAIALSADAANNALAVTVTGLAATSIRWAAVIEAIELAC